MSEWRECILGDVANIQTGPFGSQLHSSDYVDVGIPSIMPTNIGTRLDISKKNIACITDFDAQRLDRYLVKDGDIVYSRRGDVEKCAFITNKESGWLCGTGCLRVRFTSDEVSPKFCAYYLSTEEMKGWISGHSVGTTMPNLNSSILRRLPLTLPTFSEQKTIAAVLSSLDDKIDLLHRQNLTLEAMAETLFRQWFVVEVQEDWVDTTLEQHTEVFRGLSYKGSGLTDKGQGLPMHNLNSVYEGGGYKHIGIKYYSGDFKERHLVNNGDIIVTNTEQGHDLKLIGFPAIVSSFFGEKGIFSQHIYRIIPKSISYLTTEYFYYLLMTPIVREQITSATNGSTVNMLAIDGLQRPEFKLPPKEKIIEFTVIVKSWWKKKEINHNQIQTLESLRNTLLPKLMSGEVRVNLQELSA
jgi:type I restriction enzyme S subunit